MNSSGNFKLGLFVVTAVVLLVLMLLAFGVLNRFRPSLVVETYFTEPIRGLQPGAPVRFRGLPLGTVTTVTLASAQYPEDAERDQMLAGVILVEMSFDKRTMRTVRADIENELDGDVQDGLRARLASTGLGGPTYIELDYLDPVRFPAQAPEWRPNDLFVPSAPSTQATIIESLNEILADAAETDLIHKIADLGPKMHDLLDKLVEGDLLPELQETLAEAGDLISRLETMLEDERLGALLDDATATMRSVRELVDEGDGRLGPLLDDLASMAAALETTGTSLTGFTRQVEETQLLEQLDEAAAALGPAGGQLQTLAADIRKLIRRNEGQVADVLESLRRASLQLETVLEEAERNPSGMIFGDPPPKGPPGGRP